VLVVSIAGIKSDRWPSGLRRVTQELTILLVDYQRLVHSRIERFGGSNPPLFRFFFSFMDTKNNYNALVVGDMGNCSVLLSYFSVVASAGSVPDRGIQLIVFMWAMTILAGITVVTIYDEDGSYSRRKCICLSYRKSRGLTYNIFIHHCNSFTRLGNPARSVSPLPPTFSPPHP
jgi:hypothetical protein